MEIPKDLMKAVKKATKPKKEKVVKVKKEKIPVSEKELLEKQAARMLKDMDRLQQTQDPSKKTSTTAVDIWKDTDFYFSVVFQSAQQKYEFLEQFSKKFGLGVDEVKSSDEVFSIVNGIKLSQKLGFNIRLEKKPSYVYPDLELREMALDADEFKTEN